MVPDIKATRRKTLKGIGVASAVGLSGCTSSLPGSSSSDSVSMTMASNFNEGHVLVKSAKKLKKEIEKETDGNFTVDISPGAQYGSAAEMTQTLKSGGIDATATGTAPFDQYAPKYFFFQTPFVPKGYDHILRLMDSDIMSPAFQKLKNTGNQRPLGKMIYRGTRQLCTKKDWGSVHKAKDVEGLDLRVTPWETWIKIWSAVGVNATSVDWPEVYTALQTGTVSAVEAPPGALRSAKHYEVVDFLNKTQNLTTVGGFFINDGFYNGLDKTYQETLQEVAKSASDHGTKLAKDNEQKHINYFSEQGVKINNDVDAESFQKAATPAVKKLFKNRWASGYDAVMSV